MIHRFATYEDAGIYAGAMRAEGYHAAILDEHMGFIYGPLAIGGFRVIVSDDPVEDDLTPSAVAEKPGALDEIHAVLMAIAATCLALVVITAGWSIIRIAGHAMRQVAEWAAHPGKDGLRECLERGLPVAISLGFFICLPPLMIAMTRALRDERSIFGICARVLVVMHVAVNLLGMLGGLLYTIWCDAHPQFYQ